VRRRRGPLPSKGKAYIANLPPAKHHGINRVDNVGRSGHPPRAYEIPLAGAAAQFLALDNDNRQRDDSGRLQLLRDGPAAAGCRDTMVCISFPVNSSSIANSLQVFPLLDHCLRPFYPVHLHDAIPNIPTATAARDCGNGFFHTVRAVDGRAYRHFH
jgi:hypothetical protein